MQFIQMKDLILFQRDIITKKRKYIDEIFKKCSSTEQLDHFNQT